MTGAPAGKRSSLHPPSPREVAADSLKCGLSNFTRVREGSQGNAGCSREAGICATEASRFKTPGQAPTRGKAKQQRRKLPASLPTKGAGPSFGRPYRKGSEPERCLRFRKRHPSQYPRPLDWFRRDDLSRNCNSLLPIRNSSAGVQISCMLRQCAKPSDALGANRTPPATKEGEIRCERDSRPSFCSSC